jgi:hypothetical protein
MIEKNKSSLIYEILKDKCHDALNKKLQIRSGACFCGIFLSKFDLIACAPIGAYALDVVTDLESYYAFDVSNVSKKLQISMNNLRCIAAGFDLRVHNHLNRCNLVCEWYDVGLKLRKDFIK